MEKMPPILTKIHQGDQLGDEKIGEGFETGNCDNGRGIRRKTFSTETGKFNYADRSLNNEYEAKRVMQIYQILKNANLPVVDFAKTIRKKVDGVIKYELAMEDLTENGKFTIKEVSDCKIINGNFYYLIPQIIAESPNSITLQEKMIKTLAIMHNNDVVDFHPGLSFALRTIMNSNNQQIVVDFRIIDYPNLTIGSLPFGWSGEYNFEEECQHDLNQLLKGITANETEANNLQNLYNQIRQENIKKFN